MAGKRPIDNKRESAVMCTVGSPDDGTPITEMFSLNDGLVLITKNAVYEVKLADQIDPKRENPNLPPNVQRRILEIGTDSELIGRILLTAKKLFRKEFLPSSVDLEKALSLSFEVLIDMVAMHTTATEYEIIEKREIAVAENREQKDGSFAIPSISDVKTRCKTFFQKADHIEQTIWDIVRLFFSEVQTKCNFNTLHNFIESKYGTDDNFTKFISHALPFLKMVRNTRDCLDHRNAKGVNVTDFALLADGKIAPPAIEIKFRDTHQPPVALSVYMPLMVEGMLNVVEHLMAFLCSKHVQSFAGFPIQIGVIPEDLRSNKYVQFGYLTNISGEFAPIG